MGDAKSEERLKEIFREQILNDPISPNRYAGQEEVLKSEHCLAENVGEEDGLPANLDCKDKKKPVVLPDDTDMQNSDHDLKSKQRIMEIFGEDHFLTAESP